MSVLGHVLSTCFERMKTTSQSRQKISQHSPFSLQEGVIERVNPKLYHSHKIVECGRTNKKILPLGWWPLVYIILTLNGVGIQNQFSEVYTLLI